MNEIKFNPALMIWIDDVSAALREGMVRVSQQLNHALGEQFESPSFLSSDQCAKRRTYAVCRTLGKP